MTLKSILPYEKYVLTTNLSVENVLKRIAENIQPKQGFKFSLFYPNYTKPYTGDISGTTFIMTRNIKYRNSFLPVIEGNVIKYGRQTQVNIKMRLDTIVLVFIALWLCIVGLFCVGVLLFGNLHFDQTMRNGYFSGPLIPFGMFAFGCLIPTLGFKFESIGSKKFLARLLESNDQ